MLTTSLHVGALLSRPKITLPLMFNSLQSRLFRGSNRQKRSAREHLKRIERQHRPPMKVDTPALVALNLDAELMAFSHRFGLAFKDHSLLRRAFSVNDNGEGGNQVLAGLGYYLSCEYVMSYLHDMYFLLADDCISRIGKYLTGRKGLKGVIDNLSVAEYVIGSSTYEEVSTSTRSKDDLAVDALYGFIGAVYFEHGEAEACRFIQDFIVSQLYSLDLATIISYTYTKRYLEQIIEGIEKPAPEPRRIGNLATDSDIPIILMGVYSGETLLGKGAHTYENYATKEAYYAALCNLMNSCSSEATAKSRKYSDLSLRREKFDKFFANVDLKRDDVNRLKAGRSLKAVSLPTWASISQS